MLNKVLVISGHPDLSTSFANKIILEKLSQSDISLTIRRLDETCKGYTVRIADEQKALVDADIIVFQFPFQWYAAPALFKFWIDKVFTFGFAYGEGGDKLKDKDSLLSFTTGARAEDYRTMGYQHFPVEELLKPLEQTLHLTQAIYHPPVYSQGMIAHFSGEDTVRARAEEHAERLIARIRQLQEA